MCLMCPLHCAIPYGAVCSHVDICVAETCSTACSVNRVLESIVSISVNVKPKNIYGQNIYGQLAIYILWLNNPRPRWKNALDDRDRVTTWAVVKVRGARGGSAPPCFDFGPPARI